MSDKFNKNYADLARIQDNLNRSVENSLEEINRLTDEIAELKPATQAKLLRFLESGECLPVGDVRPVVVDVRVLAATNLAEFCRANDLCCAVKLHVAEEDDGELAMEPFIETARCTTCHECVNLNRKLFAYNDAKQAYIKDPKAGSFAEIVQAAEKCTAEIIHPGTPLNPKEKDLEKWIARAAPFN